MTRLGYDSDITNEQWDIIKPLFEKRHHLGWGRPRTVDTREVINAIFYCNKTGCQFRSLPHDFPKWFIVYYHYRKWQKNGTWEDSNRELVAKCRKVVGRDPENPTIACIDSQSIKGTSESGGSCSGFDGNKKINGRKRHIVSETMGYVLGAKVHAANEADTKMAPELVLSVFMRFALISVRIPIQRDR